MSENSEECKEHSKNRTIKCRETYLQKHKEARKVGKDYFCSICLSYASEDEWNKEHRVCYNCYNGKSRIVTWWNYCEPDKIIFLDSLV